MSVGRNRDEESWGRAMCVGGVCEVGGRILNRVLWESLSEKVKCEQRLCHRKTLSWRTLHAEELLGHALRIPSCRGVREARMDRKKLTCMQVEQKLQPTLWRSLEMG